MVEPEPYSTRAASISAEPEKSLATNLTHQRDEPTAGTDPLQGQIDSRPDNDSGLANSFSELLRGIKRTIVSYFTDGNVFVRVGLLMLFFGVAFLLKYAAENPRIPLELRFLGAAAGGLALIMYAVLGGFLAPLLASTGSGNYIVLFSYYSILNAVILLIAWFKSWRLLNLSWFRFHFRGLYDLVPIQL
jgi:uncharacterized membrane protein